jgi:molecular chaperone DnaK
MNGRVVGIDLGTSNSVVCAVVDGEAIVIPDGEGQKIQPSVVSFLPDGRTIVGRQAKSRMAIDPLNTIYSAKRLIGRPFYAPEINLAISKYAYQIVKGSDENPKIFLRGRHYSIEEVQAIIPRRGRHPRGDYGSCKLQRAAATVDQDRW